MISMVCNGIMVCNCYIFLSMVYSEELLQSFVNWDFTLKEFVLYNKNCHSRMIENIPEYSIIGQIMIFCKTTKDIL